MEKKVIKQINHIQLRAARYALNMSTKDIAKLLGVSNATISSHEILRYGVVGTEIFLAKHSDKLISFFTEHNIIFPDNYSIELKVSDDVLNRMPKTGGSMTRFQLRAARYILKLSQAELSKLTGINEGLIGFHECKNNTELLYSYRKEELAEEKYKQWFLSHGIEFIGNFKVVFKKSPICSQGNLI